MIRHRPGIAAAAALLLLTGCLPYSCRREESTVLMSADSVSRALADDVAMDTLALDWTHGTANGRALQHPRTVRFGPAQSDTLYVSDVEAGLIFVFDTAGTFIDEIETVDVPFLAGVRGDTVAVFDPSGPAMHFLVDGESVEIVPIQDPELPRTALVYGAFGDAVYYKRVDADGESFVAEVSRDGTLRVRHPLPGPHWRHAGLLRVWGDTVISLSGFRPVIDVVTPSGTMDTPGGTGNTPGDTAGFPSGTVDTLALRGFDSPMLARTRSFLMGDIHEPPLLSSSAAASADLLFVLNMRTGWLQVDVFDQSGHLVHRLTERGRTYRKAFFPQDLDVRRRADGSYAIAVAFTAPEPEVRLYAWQTRTTQ